MNHPTHPNYAQRLQRAFTYIHPAALAAPVAAPFAYFFRNVEKNLYEQVMPGAAGQPGIIAAYAAPVAAQPASRAEKSDDLLSSLVGIILNNRQRIGYVAGSPVDQVVKAAVDHLKDWPFYAQPVQPAVPVTDAGYFYNLVMHALMDVDAPHGGCKSRLKDIAEKLEVLMIASRGQA